MSDAWYTDRRGGRGTLDASMVDMSLRRERFRAEVEAYCRNYGRCEAGPRMLRCVTATEHGETTAFDSEICPHGNMASVCPCWRPPYDCRGWVVNLEED